MSNQSQYGRPLFISDFKEGTPVVMERIQFVKRTTASSPYDEAWVQRLIMSQPEILPIDQIEPAFADMVPLCIELPTSSGGFLDNLFVTPTGNLTLVECKLWRNPEARREVIGQIIEYAKDLSRCTYEDLQAAVHRAKRPDGFIGKVTGSLYQAASARGEIDEAAFHDALSRNLRRGRFLLLVVGDGIREGIEKMTEFLQQHAGLHFTLGIVELALFQVPKGGYIAQPRILARTTNIDRGIVTVDPEGRIAIKPKDGLPLSVGTTGVKMTITRELFLEKLEARYSGITQRLNRFMEKLAAYGVRPDTGVDSMTLRWSPDGARPWNLGSIGSGVGFGQVWMDFTGRRAQTEGLIAPFKQLLTEMAKLVPGAYVKQTPKEVGWYVADENGRIMNIDSLLTDEDREDGWIRAIEEFQEAVTRSLRVSDPNAG